jgi:hypothetical protein
MIMCIISLSAERDELEARGVHMSHELSQSEARIKETARAAAEASEQSASQVRQSEFWVFFHVFFFLVFF